MENVILWILAAGAVLGGIDLIFGNRFGLGERFEEGFKLLGPTALSMAGILCLAPLISLGLEHTVASLYRAVGLDPAMLGGILAIDMGGYQMAKSLAENPDIGKYAGILVSATLGCTVSFTIPLSVGVVEEKDSRDFFRGILIGLAVMPIALVLGLVFIPKQMLSGFSVFAKLIRLLSIVGLILGAVQYITGKTFVPNLAPIEDAMKVVSGIGVVMLGSLPMAEILRRLLSSPLKVFGEKYGLRDTSLTALLIGFVSVTPAVTMIKDMDSRGKTMNAAFIVCAASTLASHLGFTLSVEPDMMTPLLLTKLIGGAAAAVIAFFVCGKSEKVK